MHAGGHLVDRAFARWQRGGGLFAQGWGDWELHYRVGAAATDVEAIDPLDVTFTSDRVVRGGLRLLEGVFTSPLGDEVPARTRLGRFWWLRPSAAPGSTPEPVWVHMAGTGEGGPQRRLFIGRPLATRGTSSLILENPYYGLRAPVAQQGNDLRTVSDLLRMCRASVREARALLGWLGERGHRYRGVSGYSMGGHIAALAASTYPQPVACAAMASGLSAVPIFCNDALSRSIRWDVLADGAPEAAKQRMAQLVGISDLNRFGPPLCPQAAIVLGAQTDGYVRSEQVHALHQHWPGSELRWMRGGHVTTYLRRKPLLDALTDAMNNLQRHHPEAAP